MAIQYSQIVQLSCGYCFSLSMTKVNQAQDQFKVTLICQANLKLILLTGQSILLLVRITEPSIVQFIVKPL